MRQAARFKRISQNLLVQTIWISYWICEQWDFSFVAGQPFPLSKGVTNYNFSFDLKPDLPSTFVGESGKIKYKMEFVVNKSWKFDEKQTIVLNIIQAVNLNHALDILQPYEYQQTKNIGLKPMPISLHVLMPKRGFVQGEKITVQVVSSALDIFLWPIAINTLFVCFDCVLI